MENEIIVVGFDPGKTTGYGVLSVESGRFRPLDIGASTDETLQELVPLIERADIVVIEGFWINPAKARQGHFDYDDMIAPQVVGALQMKARELGKKVAVQQAAIKPVGYGYIGKKYVKGKKNMHQWDALAHAAYYCVRDLHAMPAKTNVS